MKKQLLAVGVCAALGLASNASFAQDHASGSLNLSLTLSKACNVNTGGMTGNLGTHSAGLSVNNGNNIPIGDLLITCANSIAYSWGVNCGLYKAAPGSTARLRSGKTANYVAYSIETTATPDADTVGDKGLNAIDPTYPETCVIANAKPGVGTGQQQPIALYLNPVGEETAPSGRYTDTITFTIVWP